MAGWIRKIFQRHALATIVALAALTVAVIVFVVRLDVFGDSNGEAITVYETGGVYDLTGMNLGSQSSAQLLPGECYYPGQYVTPDTLALASPVDTALHEEVQAGYLTQRFVVLTPQEGMYRLTFTVARRHSFRVYVNGQLAGEAGVPGTTKAETEVWLKEYTCMAFAQNGKLDILLQTAQFYRDGIGALLSQLNVESAPGNQARLLTDRDEGFVATGILLFAAIFLLLLYFLNRKALATLYFALACLSTALRKLVMSEAWTGIPLISGNTAFMLQYLSLVLITVFLTLYLAQTLMGRFWQCVKWAAIVSSIVYGGCVLLTDSLFYTQILIYYQVVLVALILCGMIGLFWSMRRPNAEQGVALYGVAVFYITSIADILMYNNLLGGGLVKVPATEAAMLVFVVAQSLSLFLANNRMIVQAQQAQQQLRIEKAVLEERNRMKAEFLGNISHELKTPIAIVGSNIQHVRGKVEELPGFDDVENYMKLIEGEASRMGVLVSQLADVARIDEGSMMIAPSSVSVIAIIQQTVNTYYSVLNKNGNKLRLELPDALPPVWADGGRVVQVLINLINNAARHTQQGRIIIGAKQAGEYVQIFVEDNGAGIPRENLQQLFKRYKTGLSEDAKKETGLKTGTGLGLYICKHIIEAHGGEITVQSQPGEGTMAAFTLPIRRQPS